MRMLCCFLELFGLVCRLLRTQLTVAPVLNYLSLEADNQPL
jgi:hypothetical protein